ncbi:MAG: bifunctional phosphoribosylaminoimidazolecarboxamide formyltransferase/IMP cyclohydrolase [Paracoccaceae bacterium]
MTDIVPLRRALISVSDKTGLVELARALAGADVEILSTGGTAAALREAGLDVRDVAEVTGQPEMMGGRVKTLHPRIHGGLLALRDDTEHRAAMEAHGVPAIDLLVVNLYPFEDAVARGADRAEAIETIDIGGPAMIRAAAKNHAHVAVATEAEDYAGVLAELAEHGGTTLATRRALALSAFGRTAAYDAAVSAWMARDLDEPAPRWRAMAGRLIAPLRYGENPHQGAAFYARTGPDGVAQARQVQGKALSWNNIHDLDAALRAVSDLPADRPACVIVKHANPCGAAVGETPADAYRRAFDCDRTSAFGGIVAFNRPLDAETAAAVTGVFTEVVFAPGLGAGVAELFAAKPNLRLMDGPLMDPAAPDLSLRPVGGGFLAQDVDAGGTPELRVVTRRQPTAAERADMLFAWAVARHVRSNAIVYARGGATVGIGAGQSNRRDSSRIAAAKAAEMAQALGLERSPAEGAAVASDAFFPFPDGLLAAAEAGATAVIQPGGAMRDAEVIAAADEAGLAMAFTGMRHFRH